MDYNNTALHTLSFPLSLSQVAAILIRATLTCVFAIVGVFLGALTGALIGLATASGVLRGSISGAISGALSSVEVVEASLVIWQYNGSGQWSVFYMTELLHSLLSGRLVYEKVDPALESAVQSQLSELDVPFLEVLDDIFETGGIKGMPRASLDKLPKISIQMEGHVDARTERISCAVCLQDFQIGETARSLPQCQHMFHLPCVDSWLTSHGSCPLCRRNFSEPFLIQ